MKDNTITRIYCANKKCRKDCTGNFNFCGANPDDKCCSIRCSSVVMGELERAEWLRVYPELEAAK